MSGILAAGEDVAAAVLKVPHHGANLGAAGEAFVKEINPKFSIISVGEKNAFGHPSSATLDVLMSIPGNRIFRTDKDNAIAFVSDGAYVKTVD